MASTQDNKAYTAPHLLVASFQDNTANTDPCPQVATSKDKLVGICHLLVNLLLDNMVNTALDLRLEVGQGNKVDIYYHPVFDSVQDNMVDIVPGRLVGTSKDNLMDTDPEVVVQIFQDNQVGIGRLLRDRMVNIYFLVEGTKGNLMDTFLHPLVDTFRDKMVHIHFGHPVKID